jgi:Domain of Unknown Function with PDB structure (DUF3857)/Transglutaminase-like superfamily
MKFPRGFSYLCLLLICLLASFAPTFAGGDDWRPIDPAELAMKTPVVEKNADAEVLLWEGRVLDEIEGVDNPYPRTVINHYFRIKIFTERGKDSQSKVDIPYGDYVEIKDLAARTIKPDGSIVELDKKDFFDRIIVKQGGRKIKAKSFAMPNVEPGAIIEYRYREVRNNTFSYYERLDFQREIPVQTVKYSMMPLVIPGLGFQLRSFNGNVEQSFDKKTGFVMTMKNVPAFHEEPKMPPEYEVRPYALVFYTTVEESSLSGDKYWKDMGRRVFEEYKSNLKVKDDVEQAASGAIAGASTDEQKLQNILDFVRTKIKNTDSVSSGLTPEDHAKLKANKSPVDTLKRGSGTGKDISLLFGAMAMAAGFDVRVVRIGNRAESFFSQGITMPFFLPAYDIAVKVGSDWRVIDPSTPYVPIGMLLWQEEGEDALVSDPKDSTFIKTPISAADKSLEKRIAKLKLTEDGTIEGDVRVEYTGHLGIEMKRFNDGDSAVQREQNLRDKVKERMSTAELSDIKIENANDQVKPFVYAYHVRVPGYAQRTGKRLFLQPGFFEHGVGPLFSTSERKYNIYFHYAWSEQDEVTIDLPAGFSLDNADAPAPFGAGSISQYKVTIGVADGGKSLIYRRNFFFGGKDVILFPSVNYPALKQLFDALHTQDNHTISLKVTETSN